MSWNQERPLLGNRVLSRKILSRRYCPAIWRGFAILRHMLRFLTGTDHYRIRLRERALAKDFSAAYPGTEELILDGRDAALGILSRLNEGLSGGLFARPRVIAIRHVELFDEELSQGIIKELDRTLPEDALVIASAEPAGRAKKGNALQGWLTKEAEVETVDILAGRALIQSIMDILHGIDPAATIESRAIESLAIRTAGATGHIYHALLKLVLITKGKLITDADVRSIIDEQDGESVSFALLDAVVRGDRSRAISLFRREETDTDALFRLLGLFAWQIRQAIQVRDEYERGMVSADSIAAAIGAKPFSVKKLMPLISKLPLSRLKHALAALSDLDCGMKTGQVRPGVGLDLFIWKF